MSIVKKNAIDCVDAIVILLGKGYEPFSQHYIENLNQPRLTATSPISLCMDVWVKHREERKENNQISCAALKNNKILIKHFTDWLTKYNYLSRKVGSFTVVDIDNFLGFKSNERKWGKVSYNTYRTDLNTFFNYLKKTKVIFENPVEESEKKNIKNDSSRFVIYEVDELRNVVRTMKSDPDYFGLYIASKMLYLYNIRPIEMTRIQIADLNFQKHTLRLPSSKTKNEREAIFALNDEMYNLLKDLTMDCPQNYFVFGPRCKPSELQVEQQYFTQKFRHFRTKYGFGSHLKFYALKHSSNFYDLEDGASFYSIMEKNRHSSLQVTTAYIKDRLHKKIISPTINRRFD